MKKLLAVVAVFCVAVVAKADYLQWLVNVGDPDSTYDGAQLRQTTSNTTTGGDIIAQTKLSSGVGVDMTGDNAISVSPTSPEAWFYIELGNYTDGNFTAQQVAGAYSYSELVAAGLITTDSINPATGQSFGMNGATIAGRTLSYTAVPEPGTASLIILGLAIAGLKRRRA